MTTTEQECLDALREAAERLGESPTKAAYEDLGLTPASATIIRVVGGGTRRSSGLDWTRIGPAGRGCNRNLMTLSYRRAQSGATFLSTSDGTTGIRKRMPTEPLTGGRDIVGG